MINESGKPLVAQRSVINNLPEGIILKSLAGFYEVLDKTDMQTVYTCKVRGVYRKVGEISPLAGDYVIYRVLDMDKNVGHIEDIIERRNFFVRPAVANIDQMAIVMAVAPSADLMLVDKLLITCQINDIRPLLIINKTDLDHENIVENLSKIYRRTGFDLVHLSKFLEDDYEILNKKLNGYKTAFAGQSGVGKSTILNAIFKYYVMETGEISHRIQSGKHTTRHVELFRLEEGGFIVDTPGFSSYSIIDTNYEDLETFYPEFNNVLGNCRFKGCSHIGEPDCAVRDLLDRGFVDEGRYNRYVELYKELKDNYDNRYRR